MLQQIIVQYGIKDIILDTLILFQKSNQHFTWLECHFSHSEYWAFMVDLSNSTYSIPYPHILSKRL